MGDDGRHVVYALCDDGTMWARHPNAENERLHYWRKISDIPLRWIQADALDAYTGAAEMTANLTEPNRVSALEDRVADLEALVRTLERRLDYDRCAACKAMDRPAQVDPINPAKALTR